MLPIFYINLAMRPDRRDFMDRQLADLGLIGRRIEAVTGEEVSQEDAERYCNVNAPSFLRRRELACTLSHERAWRAMLDEGHDAALFLEDDAVLSPLLPAFLAEVHAIDADLVRIEKSKRIRVYPVRDTGPSGVSIREFRSTPMGAAGYILKASAARQLLGHPGLRRRQVDLALYDPFEQPGASLSRVITDPALCRQLGSQDPETTPVGRSDLAHDSVQHVFAEKRPLSFLWFKLRHGVVTGLRNTLDHLAQQPRGLERRAVLFHQGNVPGTQAGDAILPSDLAEAKATS